MVIAAFTRFERERDLTVQATKPGKKSKTKAIVFAMQEFVREKKLRKTLVIAAELLQGAKTATDEAYIIELLEGIPAIEVSSALSMDKSRQTVLCLAKKRRNPAAHRYCHRRSLHRAQPFRVYP